MPNGLLKIAGLPLEEDLYQTDLKIEDEQLAALLKEALKPKKKKGAKKEGGEPVAEAPKKEAEPPKKKDEKKPAKSPKKP